jgi:hypothetical protein
MTANTSAPQARTIAVVDLGDKLDLGRLEGVILGEIHAEDKRAALIRSSSRTRHRHSPTTDVRSKQRDHRVPKQPSHSKRHTNVANVPKIRIGRIRGHSKIRVSLLHVRQLLLNALH